MKCIFCNNDSSTSKSVEHIVPESLGNKDIILPKGFVCDVCNNYFARKIEKPLLESLYFTSMRARNEIYTKKGRAVLENAYFGDCYKNSKICSDRTKECKGIYIENDIVVEEILDGRITTLRVPFSFEEVYPNAIMSRFLAKCALEYLVFIIDTNKQDEFIEDEVLQRQLDPIRKFARYDVGEWGYNQRRIYNESEIWINDRDEEIQPYETLHEMCIFFRDYKKCDNGQFCADTYFALVIMGVEYVICISDPDISGYNDWLKENNYKSPVEREFEHCLN
ncbi:MAG: HNH endonuclease [Rikenellaceae bacterium]